jgi:hypothetical protein
MIFKRGKFYWYKFMWKKLACPRVHESEQRQDCSKHGVCSILRKHQVKYRIINHLPYPPIRLTWSSIVPTSASTPIARNNLTSSSVST